MVSGILSQRRAVFLFRFAVCRPDFRHLEAGSLVFLGVPATGTVKIGPWIRQGKNLREPRRRARLSTSRKNCREKNGEQ